MMKHTCSQQVHAAHPCLPSFRFILCPPNPQPSASFCHTKTMLPPSFLFHLLHLLSSILLLQSTPFLVTAAVVPTAARRAFWGKFSTIDSLKSPPAFSVPPSTSTSEERPTLVKFKYLIIPIWWSDEDATDPSTLMDMTNSEDVMARVNEYYDKMSWNRTDLSYSIHPEQQQLCFS
jgi:hypothetical protein